MIVSAVCNDGGVRLCEIDYCCETEDEVCVDDFAGGGYCDIQYGNPDPDCPVYTVSGTVTGAGQGILNAKVSIFSAYYKYTTYTINANGDYSEDVSGGMYDVSASYPGFEPQVMHNQLIDEDKTYDFDLVETESNCLSDCTREGSELCDANCQDWNVCDFWSDGDYLGDVCDNKGKGWIVSFDDDNNAKCCTGPVTPKEEGITPVKVEPVGDNIVRISRIVNYKGEQVKMLIDVWG